MSGGPAFHGKLESDAAKRGRDAGLIVLLAAFVVIAIAKPWGGSVEPSPSAGPSAADALPPPPSLPTNAPEEPSAAPSAVVAPLPVAFTTPRPPSVSATWTGLRWRRLAPDDPLSILRSVTRWRGGFIAVGWQGVPPRTPIWTSADGRRWVPLISGTSATFWPGFAVLGVAEGPTGLVAVTEAVEFCGEPCVPTYVPLVVSWTSPDGRRWRPHPLFPAEWLATPNGSAPLVAMGPPGLVVASSGPAAHFATSTDGSHWSLLPAGAFPARFALNDLRYAAPGYVALGHWLTGDGVGDAATLWSADGRHWSATPTALPTSVPVGPLVGSAVASLLVGRDGMVAVGRDVNSPGAALWWQSPDGRHWTALPEFPPLGPTTCRGGFCALQSHGVLVGDGERLVVVQGGDDGSAWVSSDGRSWKRLATTGDLPSADAYAATLLPGGVLLTNGPATWFGEAVVR
jgi:hypothetical protein